MDARQLLTNLEEQTLKHKALELLLREELCLPPDCSLECLEEIGERKEALVDTLSRLEEQRLALLRQAEECSGQDIPTIQVLITCIFATHPSEADLIDRLQQCHTELISVITSIRQLAAEVAFQASARLICFRQTAAGMRNSLKQDSYYQKNGSIKHKSSAHFVHRYA